MTSKDHCQNTDSVRALDGSDEAPLHVDHQTNLDDMVPNATVFRQVNIMVDRDRGNDANLALGQFQATVRAFQEDGSSGPVQQTRKIPKWRDALLTLLMFLTVLFACLAYFGRLSWLFAGATVLLCAALLALPLWLEHRNWVKEAQRLDFEREHARTGMDPAVYERARKKRRQLILLGVFGALLLTGGIYALARAIYTQEHPDTDYRICFASVVELPAKKLSVLGDSIAPLVGDLDGNGKEITAIDLRIVSYGNMVSSSGTTYHTTVDFNDFVGSGEYPLLFLTNLEYQGFNASDGFKFYRYCRALPEDLADPDNLYWVDLSSSKLFAATDLTDIPVYGCISAGATETEYEFAVELLHKILAE